MFPLDNKPTGDKKEAATMAQRILGFCFAVFLGVILLYLAVHLLAQFWGWLLLITGVIVAVIVTVRIWRARRDGW